MGPVTVVIAAAAQSVAKVLVIGLVGYVSVLCKSNFSLKAFTFN
jgi:hypothetical protein